MPNKYTVNASCATGEVTFLKLMLNGSKVPLSADGAGNFSGSTTLSLPDSFQGTITIKALRPTGWTVSLEVLTIPNSISVLKQDIKGTIKEKDNLKGSWSGQLKLSAATPAAAKTAQLMLKAAPKKATATKVTGRRTTKRAKTTTKTPSKSSRGGRKG
jgi:hypothetical protein